MDWIIALAITAGIVYLAAETAEGINNTINLHHADDYWMSSMAMMFILMMMLATC